MKVHVIHIPILVLAIGAGALVWYLHKKNERAKGE